MIALLPRPRATSCRGFAGLAPLGRDPASVRHALEHRARRPQELLLSARAPSRPSSRSASTSERLRISLAAVRG